MKAFVLVDSHYGYLYINGSYIYRLELVILCSMHTYCKLLWKKRINGYYYLHKSYQCSSYEKQLKALNQKDITYIWITTTQVKLSS